jgi:hypothetical protein
MPFELGFAHALRQQKSHQIILLDSRTHRLAKRLSDLTFLEPLIHGKGPLKLINVLTDNIGTGANLRVIEAIYRKILGVLPGLKRDYRSKTAFTKSIFKELVSGTGELVHQAGILR